jgi:MFS transporter, DHA2 family, multidrug resistance protein
LMFIGFGIYGGMMNGEASRADFFYVLIFRSLGISFMQLPLINQAVAGVSPRDYPAAIAINNMIRQLGGAFGVAIANNYVSTHYAQHRADLIANVYASNPTVTERLANITNGIIAKTGDPITASQQALASLNFAVDKQAYLLSYLDTFRMISYFFIAVFPLIFLLKTKKTPVPPTEEAKKAMMEAH